MIICLDPGHGMSNRKSGVYDSGASVMVAPLVKGVKKATEITEAEIVMNWANELRSLLLGMGHQVIRTRMNATDPAPVAERAAIAKRYGCMIFISLHCNAADGRANGTETFYRNAANKALAQACTTAVVEALGTKDRGIKTESQSQHSRLAVLNFPRAVLIELGFIDHAGDRAAMLDATKMLNACQSLAEVITS